jgi:hypothetical protein
MLYMFLLYGDEANQEDGATVIAGHFKLLEELQARDAYVYSEALGGAGNATSVRVRDGKTLVTDGPFAETKETMGGFYVLDCKNLDEALDYAARIPGTRTGGVEIRPVMFVEGWPYTAASDRQRRPM